MAFKTQGDDQDAMSEINVTPLVDVMLVLVIILLVTAPLLTQSVKVRLPETAETTPDIEDPPLQLGLDAQGKISLNQQPIADLPALEQALVTAKRNDPDVTVHLYADAGVNYGKVAEVMAAARHAGMTKMAFVTVPP